MHLNTHINAVVVRCRVFFIWLIGTLFTTIIIDLIPKSKKIERRVYWCFFIYNASELERKEWKNKFTRRDQSWKFDPDTCCSINKVEPLEAIKEKHQIWVSGLRAYQSGHRSSLNIFEPFGKTIKFHPIIDVSEAYLKTYMDIHNLPNHPLRHKGYSSIGCIHCTLPGKKREGRWVEHNKTECGLHVNVKK